MRRFLGVILSAVVLASCSGKKDESAAAAPDTLTRRQRDSVIANSKLPYAGAARRAMGAADAASAQARAQDSAAAALR